MRAARSPMRTSSNAVPCSLGSPPTLRATTPDSARRAVPRLAQPPHLVGDHRASEPLQFETADRRRLHCFLRRREDSLTDERLAWGSMCAEPGGEVRCRPERAVVESTLKADPAQRRVPGLDADSERQVDSALAPAGRQL